MEENKLEMIFESLLFVSRTPVPTAMLAKAADVKNKLAAETLGNLRELYRNRGIILEEIGGGWQFRTHPSCAAVLKKYLQTKPIRLTKQSIETLSMIAYLQPVTKAGIEEIRSVDSSGVIKFLMEHGFIRIIGKKEEPGRPYLYGTTRYFLEFFGLNSLTDMPTLKEQMDLTEEEFGAAVEEEGKEEEQENQSDFLDDLSNVLDDLKKEEKQGDAGK